MNKEDWGSLPMSATFGLLAGYINVLAIQSLGVAVSHVTGTVSKLGINLTSLEISVAVVGIGLWSSYVFGSGLGKFLHDKIGTAMPLLIEGVFLTFIGLFAPDDILETSKFLAALLGCFAACGMGMQNAITSCTSMSKTTHLTGASTELGIAIATKDMAKFKHMGVIIGGFAGGAFIAILANYLVGIKGFIIPGIITIGIASYNMKHGFFVRPVRRKGSKIYGILRYDDVYDD